VNKSCLLGCMKDLWASKRDSLKLQVHNLDCLASMMEKLMVNVGNKVTFLRENLEIRDLVTILATFLKRLIVPKVKSLDHLESFHLQDQLETIQHRKLASQIATESSMDSCLA
jgi:hypothetical protein